MNPTAQQPAAPQQQAPVPQAQAVGGGGPTPPPPSSPGNSMAPMVQQLMGQSQQAMNNPMGQAVPQGGGLIDALKHPMVAGLIKAIAQIAQSGGWTAMMPQERLERTQLNQQKAESLSRLAETGAYQGGSLDIRQQGADINKQKANTGDVNAATKAEDVASKGDLRDAQIQNLTDKLQLAQDRNEWQKAMASGRLDIAHQMLDQKASQFDEKMKLAIQKYGLDKAKVNLSSEGMGIKEGFLDLARTALSQKGTEQGLQVLTKLQQLAIEYPAMSYVVGLDDINKMIGESAGSGMPGVAPMSPTPAQATPTGVPAPQNKASAKKQQQGGGDVHIHYDSKGNRVQ